MTFTAFKFSTDNYIILTMQLMQAQKSSSLIRNSGKKSNCDNSKRFFSHILGQRIEVFKHKVFWLFVANLEAFSFH